ncbi:MAG: hypothetical protein NW218_00775 [Saprospiraceae bacterium]|nr:hypothetical protein [Saprospiraceae bacterium]
MSDNNNKTWAAFWSENKPMAWFMLIVLVIALGYLIYNKWIIQIGDTIKIQPSTEAKEQVLTPSDEVSKNDVPSKQTRKNAVLEKESKTVEAGKIDERHGLSMSGNVIQEDGKPAINAKIICSNCLVSNSPVFSDQAGRFKINYSIKCKDSEYPTKAVELTIFHQNKSYSASQSISQNSLTIDLK